MTQLSRGGRIFFDPLKPSREIQAPQVIPPEWREPVDIWKLVAELLIEEEVKYTFCITGGGAMAGEMASLQEGIPRVHFRHEQAAAYAADAWGRITRRPGVVWGGSAIAMNYASAGATTAFTAHSPVVIIQGQSAMEHDDHFPFLGITDAENQYKGISKWVRKVGSGTPRSLLWQIKRAFRSAVTHPTGPCVVAHPADIQGGFMQPTTRAEAYTYYKPGFFPPGVPQTMAPPVLVEQALRWLLEAEKPMMIVGHALHQDDAEAELREFVHLLGIPCTARRIARGAISEYDPLNCMGRARGRVMRDSDRCLVMGLRIGYLENWGKPPQWGVNTRYIQAQSCVEQVETGMPTEYELVGNIKMLLRQFIDCARDIGIKGPLEKWEQWRQLVVDSKEDYYQRTLERSDRMRGQMPLHPDLFGRLTSEFFRDEYQDDNITVIDGWGASSYYTDWNRVIHSGMMLDATETAGFGHAPGMAIAAGLATNREKPIFALMGDGAIGAGGGDIETASRWNIPAIFCHLNNNQLQAVLYSLWYSNVAKATGNPLLDSWETLPNLRYDRMFAEFGCHPEFIENDAQIKPALKRACDFAMREKKPAFIEVHIDPNVGQAMLGGSAVGTSHRIHWDQLSPQSQRMTLEANMVSPQDLPRLHPSWRDAVLAYQKEQQQK